MAEYSVGLYGGRQAFQSVAGIAIPDSEADQKLAHRWYLSEASSPFVDQIGGNDGANFGTMQVTGDWVDNAARDGDGTDDYIDYGSLPFVSNLNTGAAYGFSVQTSSTASGYLSGTRDGNNEWVLITVNDELFGNDPGAIGYSFRDSNANRVQGHADANINDGNPHRIIVNVVDPAANTVEVWVDGSEIPATNNTAEGPDNFADHAGAYYTHAWNNTTGSGNGNHFDGVIDDHCLFSEALTETEIQSYSPPWP